MSLVRYNPMRDLLNAEREFSRLFSDLENRFNFPSRKEADEEYENAVWMPLTDIYEDKDNYRLILDLPGLSKSDVKLSYLNGELKISGERQQQKEEKDGKFHRVERTYGKFYRSFRLPEKVKEDKIEAEFKDGQLTVVIPKAEEVKPKELQISVK
jgi:HSP20 family protein